MCMELCTRTWKGRHVVRAHMHVLLRRDQARLRVRSADSLRVLESRPFLSMEDLTRSKRAGNHQAQYYCLAPKIGGIFSFSTQQAYVDFPVNAEWVWTLIQGEKITLEDAENEFFRCVKNLPRHLAQLREVRNVRGGQRVAALLF